MHRENLTDEICPGCNAVPGEKHTTIVTVGQGNVQCPGDGRVDAEGNIKPAKPAKGK